MTKTISRILQRHMLEWLNIPGVVGAVEGIHRGKTCMLVLVERKTRELEQKFPERLDGVRLVLKEVGKGGTGKGKR